MEVAKNVKGSLSFVGMIRSARRWIGICAKGIPDTFLSRRSSLSAEVMISSMVVIAVLVLNGFFNSSTLNEVI